MATKTWVLTKFYFDTSVLLPVLIKQHETHELCRSKLRYAVSNGSALTSATHAYAELYRHLTRNRFPYDLTPEVAATAIIDNIGHLLNIISLDGEDYEAAIRRCAQLELTGAIIYDALHYQAALKAEAEVIYTDNLRDFTRLRLPDENIRIEGIR